MKSIKALAILAVMSLVLVSCGKLENVLTKKDGAWKATSQTVTEYTNDVQDTTYTETTDLGTYTFKDDGTGTFTQGNSSDAFEWTTNGDGDQLIITDSSSLAFTIDVIENKSKTQKWKSTFEITFGSDTFRTETDTDLERVD